MPFKYLSLSALLLFTFAGSVLADYSESPMLHEKVISGELPPVESRLPEEPALVTPASEIGQYGGTLRFGYNGSHPGWGGLWFVTGWENLVIWKPDFSGVTPNIAKDWTVEHNSKDYTFYLRKGLKWSNGDAFTADDILFYINDIVYNEELSPSGPIADWLPADMVDGFRVEKIDQYTISFHFPTSYGLFLYNLATWNGRHMTFFPKTYLQRYHKTYNPEIEENSEGKPWTVLFTEKAAGPGADMLDYYKLPERPVLFPWIVTEPMKSASPITLVRNPYYWKTDPEGHQLPYIDYVTGTPFSDGNSRTLAMLNGELDMIKDPGRTNRIIYEAAVEAGRDLDIRYINSDGANTLTIHFNRTVDDPLKAAVFADKNFRIGMSHAINRQEIIDLLYEGQGIPAQQAPLESSPLYNLRLANQYLEYDLETANEYLDHVLPEKDREGFRLGVDGKRFSIALSVSNDLSYGTTWVQHAQLLAQYWADAGVEVIVNSMPDQQFLEQKRLNTIEATIYTGDGGAGLTPILDPRYYVPMEGNSLYGNGWYAWRIADSAAVQVEPPQEIQYLRLTFEREVLGASTQDAQIEAMRSILEIAADRFWVIGIARPGSAYQPFNARLGNIPETWIDGWLEGVQKITYPEQWYLKP